MDGFGTSASILCDGKGNECQIRSITAGAPKYQHSQRSELAGITASLAVIEAICGFYDITQGKVIVGLDGQQAINNVQRKRARIKYSDYDLIIFIKDQMKQLPVDVHFYWIKGHQDDLLAWHHLDFYAQMNVKADRLAKSFLISNMQSHVPNSLSPFSTDQWYLIQQDIKYANVSSEQIYEDVVADNILQYWVKRGKVPLEVSDDIDWENYGVAFLKCSFAQRRRIIKLTSGHAPVGRMMRRWKKQDHARCPLCDYPEEDVHHMLTCSCDEACSAWNIALDVLDIQLSQIHTAPTIAQAILMGLRRWRISP